jgi:hypothetical protein
MARADVEERIEVRHMIERRGGVLWLWLQLHSSGWS